MINFLLPFKKYLIIGAVIGSFLLGWQVNGWRMESNQSSSITKQLKTSDTIAKDTKETVKAAQVAVAETKIIYRTIKEKIQNENDNRICFADSTALGLWNDAVSGENKPRPSTTGKTREAYAVVASVEEVLINATENFETCNTNSIKHNALIDAVESLDRKMCVCGK